MSDTTFEENFGTIIYASDAEIHEMRNRYAYNENVRGSCLMLSEGSVTAIENVY